MYCLYVRKPMAFNLIAKASNLTACHHRSLFSRMKGSHLSLELGRWRLGCDVALMFATVRVRIIRPRRWGEAIGEGLG